MPWASWNPCVDPVASCPRRSTWKPSEFWRLSPSFPPTALGRPSSPWESARPQGDTRKYQGILEILETHWYFAFLAIENHLISLDLSWNLLAMENPLRRLESFWVSRHSDDELKWPALWASLSSMKIEKSLQSKKQDAGRWYLDPVLRLFLMKLVLDFPSAWHVFHRGSSNWL